jgi:hypothetical protein
VQAWGLEISMSLASLLCGEMNTRSHVGKGATFLVRLQLLVHTAPQNAPGYAPPSINMF